MKITLEQLKAIMPQVSEKWAGEYVDAINAMATRFDMATPLRLAACLGICAYESGELNFWREIGGENMWYAPYFGRGPIQFTHQANYENAGDALDIDLVSDPDKVAQDSYVGFNCVGWFWRNANGDLNTFADDGDFWDCYLRVAGADNGTFMPRKAYYDKALEVFGKEDDAGDSDGTEYPERGIGFDSGNWAIDLETNAWIRDKDLPSATLYTDPSGWLYRLASPQPERGFSWPEANDAPDPSSWDYTERNPTRYHWKEGGRDDVDALCKWIVQNYNVSVNTYVHHPEDVWLEQGVSREYDSFDVWGPAGRGDWLDYEIGNELFNLLWYDPTPPYWEWAIWQRTIYGAWNGWSGEPFGNGTQFTNHEDHFHVTVL